MKAIEVEYNDLKSYIDETKWESLGEVFLQHVKIDGHDLMVIKRGDRYWIKPGAVSLKDALKAFGY